MIPIEIANEIAVVKREIADLKARSADTGSDLLAQIQDVEGLALESENTYFDIVPYIFAGKRIYIERVGSGIRINAESDVFKSLFSLYGTTATVVKVRGHAYAFCNAGNFSNIAAGTATIDSNITISNNTYIYIKFDRATPAITLEVASGATPTVPSGTDTIEYYPLWYIPWLSATSRIDWENVIDLRHALHMEAMS